MTTVTTDLPPVKAPPIHDPLSLVTAKMHVWTNGFFLQLPNIAAALIFLCAAYGIARGLGYLVRTLAHRRDRIDLGAIFASIIFGIVMVVALMVAAAIVFPSVKPGDILSALGVGSVAVGFAFKDILQNLFAGVLLLINRPFRRGDQIVVKDYEGTVEHIESRATLIKTYDGRRVIIPNADIYTSPVTVNTAFKTRRSQFDIGIGYGDDPARAAALFLDAVKGVEGVEIDPAPEVLAWGLDDNYVTLRARWWTDSKRTSVVHIQARVILAIYEAARDAGIDLPFPTSVVLFHDQTEATDGDRSHQREGWPAGDKPPKPRRIGKSGVLPGTPAESA